MTEQRIAQATDIDDRDDSGILRQAESIAEQLLDIVQQERRYMRKRDVDAVNALTINKQRLLESLVSLEPSLAILHQRTRSADGDRSGAFDRVIDLMQQARQANSENMSIAMTELTHAQDALALLRSMLSLDDLTLYGENGILSVNRERRRLGSA